MKKTIVVSADRGETRVAVLEAKTVKSQREVAEVYIERHGGRSLVGNIYLGKVDNVLPGMEAAFVDIGLERNGFLHVDEILLPDGQQAPRRGRGQGRRIDELIKPKQEILVQVIKDPIKSKGARLSMNVTIAGRYLVYAPNGSGVGVSRRLADKERERLRRMVGRTYEGPGGLIVRTAAHGAKKTDFVREIAYLHRLNDVLEKRKQGVKAPSLVFQEQDLPVRVLRDVFLNEFDKAVIDDQKQFDRVTSFFQRTAPELVDGVELYEGSKPLFEKWDIEKAIQSTLGARIDLPSGGYLIIDYTEALTVIDVNSGSFTGRGKGGLEETITRVNTEAAAEVVRQLRLRDIGGIIVIDFIDMARGKNRDKVLGTLRSALDADKSKSYLVEISPLGLVEMTRQNITDGVREILTVKCPTCEGEGVVLSAETVALEGLRKMREFAADDKRKRSLPDPGQPEGRGPAQPRRQRPARARGGDRQAVPLRRRRGPADQQLRADRVRRPQEHRGAGAAVQAGRRGSGHDRRAAHVQRRRRDRPDRLLHHQRHRSRRLGRRAPHDQDRVGRACLGGRFAPAGRRAARAQPAEEERVRQRFRRRIARRQGPRQPRRPQPFEERPSGRQPAAAPGGGGGR